MDFNHFPYMYSNFMYFYNFTFANMWFWLCMGEGKGECLATAVDPWREYPESCQRALTVELEYSWSVRRWNRTIICPGARVRNLWVFTRCLVRIRYSEKSPC